MELKEVKSQSDFVNGVRHRLSFVQIRLNVVFVHCNALSRTLTDRFTMPIILYGIVTAIKKNAHMIND
jgi:hypothetical protein